MSHQEPGVVLRNPSNPVHVLLPSRCDSQLLSPAFTPEKGEILFQGGAAAEFREIHASNEGMLAVAFEFFLLSNDEGLERATWDVV